ncbi:PilZ domain-containing protein [Nocardioides sp. L-11A]|uniref:PilZ domain-containing protein n=1 Tax=Nocardioides sp. L-11A TaxID=3043848 RepID=UPI00249C4200|nr:PilZ domain-containing protein [Nocardioides sp. L-11A]
MRQTAREVHPGVLQPVALTLRPTTGGPTAVSTKVLDLEPQPDGSTRLVVAPPAGLDPREHHLDGTVAWTYPLGRMECPVTTRPARRAYGDVWLLCPSAPATRLQQRAYFRARVAVPVLLRWERQEAEEPTELPGVVLDLSEGGLLATVRTPPPPVGSPVEATVRIDGDDLVQPAAVVRHVRFASGGLGVAVAFADPTVHGDRIRRLAFETERRRRHRG